MNATIIVTGSAGFIGFHLSKLLLDMGYQVFGIDALTDYYDPELKRARLGILETHSGYKHFCARIENITEVSSIFSQVNPQFVVHLAAQAGVRYSIEAPFEYVQTNLVGTFNIIELSKQHNVDHLLMASTSSVYGANKCMPFDELQKTDTPMSFYAATKKSNELMAHSYAHIFDLPITMFRFFTVYGPWGRPDMALFKFTRRIIANEEIEVYNRGEMQRDFTYVSDLVESIQRLIHVVPPKSDQRSLFSQSMHDSLSDVAPFRVVNIGNSNPVQLMDYIAAVEKALGTTAKKKFLPMQLGDVPATYADTQLLQDLIGKIPSTKVNDGVAEFINWYKRFYPEK